MSHPESNGERTAAPGPSALERAQASYLMELRAHRQPNIDDYLQRLPGHEREMLDFALYAESIAADLPDFEAVPSSRLSQPARDVLVRISRAIAGAGAANATPPAHTTGRARPRGGRALTSLLTAGRATGTEPPALAARVGLSVDLLDRLDHREIVPASVPAALIERLADALGRRPREVADYLRGTSARRVAESPAPYATRGAKPSAHPQIAFLEAVRASTLDDARKQQWAALVEGTPDSTPDSTPGHSD